MFFIQLEMLRLLPMISLPKQLENWLKPLRLEEKQEFSNQSVVKGLDEYLMGQCDQILGSARLDFPEAREFSGFLKELRGSFSQYMTLSPQERRQLVVSAQKSIKEWVGRLPKEVSLSKPPSEKLSLSDSVLPFVPKEKQRAFHLTGLKTVDDLLHFSPKWAVQGSSFTPIAQCINREEPYFILARINGISEMRRGPRVMVKVVLQDATGHLSWVWFNRPYLKKELTNGRWVLLHETPQVSKWGKQIVGKAETFEFLTPEEEQALREGKVIVFYPSTATLTQSFWRDIMGKVLDKYVVAQALTKGTPHPGPLPQGARGTGAPSPLRGKGRDEGDVPFFGAGSITEAIQEIHHPSTLESFERARKRLAFEELLALQTFLIVKRRAIEKREKGRGYNFEGERILKFRKSIPYQPTQAQKRVVKEIREDLAKPHPMNRLLQGDVGSGKTLVAAISFLYAADSNLQSAFMAPTEILAQQHYASLTKLLEPVGLKTLLLTSDMRAKAKRDALEILALGKADVAIGTHALLEENVVFKNLGFMVIDERHKFGVMQRAALEGKGKWPDCLMMTATPFPRALVLTEYGDTDLSLLDEFPKGRKTIKTYLKDESQKKEVYAFAKERILKGEQVFWVFPVVAESKTFLKSAIQMHQHFQKEVFRGFKVGLLHGKMKKEEKAAVMEAFAKKEIQLLVATTVIEVGIDIPNATVMVVEHAERFGLAQLHQLRGRVGRGENQSYCYFLTSQFISNEAKKRMKIMVDTLDGFKLSELDLKMRGPGEIFGVAQSGRREGGIVDLKRDVDVVDEARKAAIVILERDPRLLLEEQRGLRQNLESKYRNLLDLAQIS
jgi:ATP-dependent DNA helicase RecG